MNLKKFAVLTAATSGIVLAGAGAALADTSADGYATNSPGVGSGNNVQIPVHTATNITGNAINVIGLLDSVFGNHSMN
ncbi:MAG TPA: chaplin [Actinocrinis sp.]|uniref:chaplin n=1 Tax=Actinocrinis sp. TaxID=1920516 RepID=UPI002DDCBF70|nr:chaplin [Actinocrinis sp.]HEV2345234.1 chaplin [Actinocrinis sp.]